MQENKKRLLFALVLTITVVSALSASTFTSAPSDAQVAKGANLVWEKTFGGTGDDRAFYVANVADGYVVVGSSTSFGQGKTFAYIVRVDSYGNQLWNRTFNENFGAEFRYVCSLKDGFLLVGNTFLESGNVEGYVVKLDSHGNLLWNATLMANEGINKFFSGATDGNGLIVVGLTQSEGTSSNSQAWVAKLDNNGSLIWSKTFGNFSETAARSIVTIQDNRYMVAGYVDSSGNGNYDFLVLKIDADGNLLWSKTYGGAQSDKAYSITSELNSCVIAGDTRSRGSGDSDAWIIKIDLNGTLLWDQTAGGSNYDSPSFITVSPAGGCVVTGTTFSFGSGQRDFWLFQVNDYGRVVWSSTVGRSGYEEAYGIACAGGNDYVIVGWTNSMGNGGRYDFYMVKVQVPSL